MDRYVTGFLQSHQESIQSWSLTSDELTIELKPAMERSDIVVFFADLITFVNPRRASIGPLNNATITLELG